MTTSAITTSNTLTKPELQEIAKRFHASSRAEGLENIRAVDGIQFYVTADAYRAAREEARGEWRHGSDARWGYEAGVAQGQVTVLSRLYGTDNNALLTSSSWSQAREVVSKLPPKDGRSTKTTVVVDGKETEGEVLSPEPERVTPSSSAAVSILTETVNEEPPSKPRKPTKAQLELQEWEAKAGRKHAEMVSILRKLKRSDIERLIELQCWPCFEDSEAWMWLRIEFDPDPPRQTEPGELLDCYGLDDTEENRRRLKQLNQGDVEALAVEPHDPDEDPSARPLGPDEELPASAAAGLGPVNQDDDDLLVIPAVFKRGRTA